MYIDPDTIRHKGELVKMWYLIDYKTMQPLLRGSFLSERAHAQVDCAEERIRVLAITYFSGNMARGETVYFDIDEGRWGPVAPRTMAEALLEVACAKK